MLHLEQSGGCGFTMKSSPPLEMQEMPAEEELEAMDAENESENGENGDISYKQKYRALKRRLKYLVYVSKLCIIL